MTQISNKLSYDIVITTGTIQTDVLNKIKKISNTCDNEKNFFQINLGKQKIIILPKLTFFELSNLISKSKMFISCHCSLTHIANNYNNKIYDIIEESKLNHYSRITNHMNNYKFFFREDFSKLSKKIISYL